MRDKEAEQVVQASTSSDISKKVETPIKRGRGRPRKNLEDIILFEII